MFLFLAEDGLDFYRCFSYNIPLETKIVLRIHLRVLRDLREIYLRVFLCVEVSRKGAKLFTQRMQRRLGEKCEKKSCVFLFLAEDGLDFYRCFSYNIPLETKIVLRIHLRVLRDLREIIYECFCVWKVHAKAQSCLRKGRRED